MNYFPINWQDGMKIRKDHLIGQEHAIRAEMQAYAAAGLNGTNYGLLAPQQNKGSFDLWLKLDQTGQMMITLSSCRAIAPGGGLIDISEAGEVNTLQISRQQVQEAFPNAKQLYILLVVDPYKRATFGGADPEEQPPRERYTRPSYRLELSAVSRFDFNTSGSFIFTVGRAIIENKDVQLDKTYVPPSTSFLAHPDLDQKFDQWLRSLEELEANCAQTLANIKALEPRDLDPFGNTTDFIPIANMITTRSMYLLSELIPWMQSAYKFQSPMIAITAIRQHAYALKSLMMIIGNSDAQKWQNFLGASLSVFDFFTAMDHLVDDRYNHQDMSPSIKAVNQYLDMLRRLYDPRQGLPTSNLSFEDVIEINRTTRPPENPKLDIF